MLSRTVVAKSEPLMCHNCNREVKKKWVKIHENMARMDKIIADAKAARKKLTESSKKSVNDKMDLVFLTPAELKRKVYTLNDAFRA